MFYGSNEIHRLLRKEKTMEVINSNTLPGDNARYCSTDALMPPHTGGDDGCGTFAGPCPMACTVTPPCYEND